MGAPMHTHSVAKTLLAALQQLHHCSCPDINVFCLHSGHLKRGGAGYDPVKANHDSREPLCLDSQVAMCLALTCPSTIGGFGRDPFKPE